MQKLIVEVLLIVNGIVASKIVEGSMTRDFFLGWLKKSVVHPITFTFTH